MLRKSKINELMKKYKQSLYEMEYYDKTFEKLWGRERIDLTLDKKLILRLQEIRKKTGVPVSRIIEDVLVARV